MRWPLMRRSTHMQEIVRQGESYRWEIERAESRARAAESVARDLTARFVHVREPVNRYDRDTTVFPIEISGMMIAEFSHPTRGPGRAALAKLIGERVAVELLGLSRDNRPDLRAPERSLLHGS